MTTVAANSREIASRCDLSSEAKSLLRDRMTPDAYVAALMKEGLVHDALVFLANWLEKREAVWWGCQCLWLVFGPKSTPALQMAVQGIVRWVIDPNETTRRQCEAVSNLLTLSHPVGTLALAAFGSSGSLSSPDLPPAPPPASLTPSAVVGALVAAADKLPDTPQAYQQFLQIGLDVAHGRNLWS